MTKRRLYIDPVKDDLSKFTDNEVDVLFCIFDVSYESIGDKNQLTVDEAYRLMHSKERSYDYQLLGRLIADCEYYLGHGHRNAATLWALNEEDQIAKMKEIYKNLPYDCKPVFVDYQMILDYEKQIIKKENK